MSAEEMQMMAAMGIPIGFDTTQVRRLNSCKGRGSQLPVGARLGSRLCDETCFCFPALLLAAPSRHPLRKSTVRLALFDATALQLTSRVASEAAARSHRMLSRCPATSIFHRARRPPR